MFSLAFISCESSTKKEIKGKNLTAVEIEATVRLANEYTMSQYQAVVDYMISLGIQKPVHIWETGWASITNS